MDMLVCEVNPHLTHDTEHVEKPSVMGRPEPPNVSSRYRPTRKPPVIRATHQRRNQRQLNTALWDSPLSAGWELNLAGVEARVAQAKPVKTVASCQFLWSRIDALVDPLLEKLIAQAVSIWTLGKNDA